MADFKDPRTGKLIRGTTAQEDAEIARAIADDPDTFEVDDDWFARARPLSAFPDLERIVKGRPPLPPEARKRRVTLHLDPDVLDRLKADGKGWQTRANAALRKALGL